MAGGGIFVALLVLLMGIMGLSGIKRTYASLEKVADVHMAGLESLLIIKESQARINAIEKIILIPELTNDQKNANLGRVLVEWKKINEAIHHFESIGHSPEIRMMWKEFLPPLGGMEKGAESLYGHLQRSGEKI